MRRLAVLALVAALAGCTATAAGTVTPGASAAPAASAQPAASAAPATTTADKGPFTAGSVSLKIDGAAITVDATKGEWSTSNQDSVLSWRVGSYAPMTPDGQWGVLVSISNGPRTKKVTAPDFAVADITDRMFQLRRGDGDMLGAIYNNDGPWETSDVTIAGGLVSVTYKGKMKRDLGKGGPATLTVEATLTGLPIPKR